MLQGVLLLVVVIGWPEPEFKGRVEVPWLRIIISPSRSGVPLLTEIVVVDCCLMNGEEVAKMAFGVGEAR